MKNPLKSFLEWDQRKWEASNAKGWKHQRVKGKWPFVLKFGLLWGLMMIAVFTLINYVLDGEIRTRLLWFRVTMSLCIGFITALALWTYTEWKYQNYLKGRF